MNNNNKNNYLIPFSIIVAGVIIAVAIVFSSNTALPPGIVKNDDAADGADLQVVKPQTGGDLLDLVRPIGRGDHILGNPDAPIKVIEYSDYECPFCKRFHFTMKKIMDEYGKKGQVAWVFRHFPIQQLHPKNAIRIAVASECVAEQAGDQGFWRFTDEFFNITPSNDQTDLDTVIPQIINGIDGVDTDVFNSCVESGQYNSHIEGDLNNAIATGGSGTPWSIIVTKSGKKFPINGALPYKTVKSIIDAALSES